MTPYTQMQRCTFYLLRLLLAYYTQASAEQGLADHCVSRFDIPLSKNRSLVEDEALFEDWPLDLVGF